MIPAAVCASPVSIYISSPRTKSPASWRVNEGRRYKVWVVSIVIDVELSKGCRTRNTSNSSSGNGRICAFAGEEIRKCLTTCSHSVESIRIGEGIVSTRL